ncbi:MAG: hemolysin III family protein [gamma proteobacterium symbiont of Bathyaustriella thionipta]|nr:hemolysin III family protein [gamma proteobacterium symbiont of Bathyaustriella thionipta]MCU7950324.1 hemolysin III family protein [gamma proteobacterium symbiont of Bathyaustriella thionipta]MCU7954599.1 hemolysin III family protein [gamma proteobacterium symbiont of Bathyaustriella thionipta]MCU7956834.1 hemolysin III family protein [gamma proteobacterium symbiont of Bathyaustriella thionipta]
MIQQIRLNNYSVNEEIAHAVIHGIGVLLSIAGLVILVAFSSLYGNAWHIVSSIIYGVTLIILYSASTLYHSIPLPRAKAILSKIDHSAIYLLIAGTYTPFLLVNLRAGIGWVLFALVWGIAVLGVVLEIYRNDRFKRLSIAMYLGLGWLVIAAIKPMLEFVGTGGLVLLLIGGLCYSLGVIFYVRKKMAYHHAIWHVFVLLGSVFHFFAVLFYVIPKS